MLVSMLSGKLCLRRGPLLLLCAASLHNQRSRVSRKPRPPFWRLLYFQPAAGWTDTNCNGLREDKSATGIVCKTSLVARRMLKLN